MRRPLILGSTQLVRLVMVVVLLAALVADVSLRPSESTAQDGAAPDASAATTPQVDVVIDPMPLAPSFVRLIGITMQPGSSIPMRSHPGPKIDRVESGVLTAVLRDEGNLASVTIGAAAASAVTAGQDVSLAAGDIIVLPIDTFYAFRNDGTEPVVLLSTVMLPAGHQRPPGITYADGEPASNAYDGVTNQILGDGVATALPASPGRFMIDQVTVSPDQPLAASSAVTMLSVTTNGVDITTDSGRVQVSRTVSPGPQRDSDPGSAYTLISGDGLFFPEGHGDITVPDGELRFTRMTLTGGETVDSGASTGVQGTPGATGVGSISIVTVPSVSTDPNSTPLPETSRSPRAAATATPAEPIDAPTAAAVEPTVDSGSGTAGNFSIGATVATSDVGVNVRSDPAADAVIVLAVEAAGSQFVVIGEPVDADGITWVQVQSLDDPSISGWISADLLVAV